MIVICELYGMICDESFWELVEWVFCFVEDV